ncbi:phosphoenolpyruvate mutase [Lichenicoccus sp.]|uniref:phosphoenolpyruvate mutase n=1 Tax=Lichenicoccus sp. TaxID=2781899 RepID=UPI003D0EB29B
METAAAGDLSSPDLAPRDLAHREPAATQSRFRRLRDLIEGPELGFLMEAHSGLSAKLVEEAGFAGIWGSGLSMSASLGLRDNNEASWTQVLEQAEYMADASSLPILLDGDTGYGNFNNVRRLVRKLCERGIAGVCIEDKLFPKTNSFIGEAQPLADMEEFCGRLRAGKDAQPDDDFVLVARVEALISGHSMDEALRRAEAYHAAGADAILMHSKKRHAGEILAFMERWGGRCPVIIVPTMYYSTPTDMFRHAGISTIIWANHLVRASITAMRETASRIHREQSLAGIEAEIVSVKDIFALTENDELEAAGERYLPAASVPVRPPGPSTRPVRGIVLAASHGAALGAYTADKPKCMVDLRGRPLLSHLLGVLARAGVRDLAVVRGYCKAAIDPARLAVGDLTLLDNDEHASTGEVASLLCAIERLRGESVVVYGDVLFRRYILDALLAVEADIVIAVDALRQRAPGGGSRHEPDPRDVVAADKPFSASYLDDQPARLVSMGELAVPEASGEWIGLLRLSARGADLVRDELALMQAEGVAGTADLPALLSRLNARHPVAVHYITGHWLDVDTITDLADARNFS